jgi:hypothetical protein
MRLVGAVLILVTTLGPHASGSSQEITRDQAREIVSVFLKSQGYHVTSPKFDLENAQDDADFPDFYLFAAYQDTAARLVTIGSYAVNRKTADLWERIGCTKIKSKAIEPLQKQLRNESSASTATPCF